MAAILNFKMATEQNEPQFQKKMYHYVGHHLRAFCPQFEPSIMFTT